MKIALLTGGGDVPGLNVCIKEITLRALDAGMEVLGIRRGWKGLLDYNLASSVHTDLIAPLDRLQVRTIDRFGGTFLHTSRANPAHVPTAQIPEFLKSEVRAEGQEAADCTPHVLRVIEGLGIDVLVPIGGDDTLSYAIHLHEEGIPVVAVPKTMDNDVHGTDYCIGFSTAVTRSVDLIDALRTTAGSHERIAVVELFGRNSGETPLVSAYLADADRVVIAEVPVEIERLARLLVDDYTANPSHYAILVVSEGAAIAGEEIVESGEVDPYGHRKLGGVGLRLGDAIHQATGINVLNQTLGYLMRSGPPDSLDRMVATSYGNLAVELLDRRRFGKMVALQNGVYTSVPIKIVTEGRKRVDVDELYDVENYRPKVAHQLGKPMFLY